MLETKDPPARRDEPVSTSRKWMILTVICTVLLILYVGVFLYFQHTGTELISRYIVLAVAAYVVVLTAARAITAAPQCRQHRNFDTLAAALRPQRAAWLVLAALMAIFAVTVPVYTYLIKHDSSGLQRYLEIYRAQSTKQPSAPANP